MGGASGLLFIVRFCTACLQDAFMMPDCVPWMHALGSTLISPNVSMQACLQHNGRALKR